MVRLFCYFQLKHPKQVGPRIVYKTNYAGMRNWNKFFCSIFLFSTAFLLASCAAVVDVGNDYDETTVFQSYSTYAWYIPDAPRGEIAGATAFDPLLDPQIKRAVESGLVKSSLRPASNEAPDIYVAYDIILPSDESAPAGEAATGTRYGYSYWYGYRYNYEFADFPTSRDPQTLSPGTIIVDIIDATTNQLVWRGWADAAIDLDKVNNNRINSIVASIMAQYPPIIGTSY